MPYLLLRVDSGNVSASYRTRAQALAAVRAALRADRAAARGVALAYSRPSGGLRIVAEDEALAALAAP